MTPQIFEASGSERRKEKAFLQNDEDASVNKAENYLVSYAIIQAVTIEPGTLLLLWSFSV